MKKSPAASFSLRLLVFGFGLLSTMVYAPAQTAGTITGYVKDRTGGMLPGVQITARHTGTGYNRASVSGEDGAFVLAGVAAGSWELRAELPGFRTLNQPGVEVTVGETVTLKLTLEVGGVNEEVTVVGGRSPVNARTSELSYLVSEGAIQALPLNGKNYTDLALLQPGVVAFPHRDGGSVVAHGLATSINGQDPRSNVYLLDGTVQNDFTNGPAGSAAGTALGTETIREFRVETNAYGAEFGRNSGGQINVLTKSGSNDFHGNLFYFHRNDNFDARNFFDGERKPEFKRHQFGATLGGPIRQDKTFFFFGYEALRENLGLTRSTFVPNLQARRGELPGRPPIKINPLIQPYLEEFPLPNGPDIGGGLARHFFGFHQILDQNFLQGRVDWNLRNYDQFFARYTYDDAEQHLPTDFPQFPRAFLSRNHFFTSEYRQIVSPLTLNTYRVSYSRTRVGQDVKSEVSRPLTPFVPGRDKIGNIDIGGIPRFGPQTSVNVSLIQNVFGFEYGLVHSRGRHLLKAGTLVERYQDNMFNPTFSLGIFSFANLASFLENRPQRFLGLTPQGALDRYWRFTLFGFYVQDSVRLSPTLTGNWGVRYEFTTMPRDIYGRDSALHKITDPAPVVGQLYQNPTLRNISPRLGLAWDPTGQGKTSIRTGYGWFFNTNNQQNLIVTVTNPPATPRIIIPSPTFPVPPFERGLGNSIRPVEWNLKNPNVHVWNLSVQQALWQEWVVTVGYAGSRGVHLLRNSDVNVPQPTRLSDGTFFYPRDARRPNPAFTTIEMKTSDGNSWYNAFIMEIRKAWSKGVSVQSSYTFSRNIDTTQASTFFSDSTNGTTSALPEPSGSNYNKGLADFHAKHNWVFNFMWEVPWSQGGSSWAGKFLGGWHLAAIGHVRSGSPLTLFVQSNRSGSLWSPSLAPGIGFDRPSLAPGRTHRDAIIGDPDRYFDPAAFVLQPAGTLGNLGRGALIGPNLRIFDLALIKSTRWEQLGEEARLQFRVEFFNLFNRANFGTPSLLAFSGVTGDGALPSLGRIRSTVTSSRQIQFGLKIQF